jgi:hypothetical protein
MCEFVPFSILDEVFGSNVDFKITFGIPQLLAKLKPPMVFTVSKPHLGHGLDFLGIFAIGDCGELCGRLTGTSSNFDHHSWRDK